MTDRWMLRFRRQHGASNDADTNWLGWSSPAAPVPWGLA